MTVCGLVEASSVIVMAPVRGPVAVGVNFTLMVHLPMAGTLVPQVLVSVKSPLGTILVIVKTVVWLLLSLRVFAALVVKTACAANVKEVGARVTGNTPVPVRLMVCVLPFTPMLSSVTVSVPSSVPPIVGVNATSMVQLAPAPSVGGQLLKAL